MVLALLVLNIKFTMDKRAVNMAKENYNYTAMVYANRTVSISDLKKDYDSKKAGVLKKVGAAGGDKYLDSVQKIASLFSKNEVQVLEVNPKIRTPGIAKNFNVLNDPEFNAINEFVLRILVNGEEAKIVESIDKIRNMREHFYIENIRIHHPDDDTRGNMDITFISNWK